MSKKPVPSKKQAVSSTKSRHKTWVRKQRKRLTDELVLCKDPVTGETKRRHFASESGQYKDDKSLKRTKVLIQSKKLRLSFL
jgi:ribosomal protein L32